MPIANSNQDTNKNINLGIDDYILKNNEEALSKRNKQFQANNNINNNTNWTSYYENPKVENNKSENQFVNEINKRRKKWNFFAPNSEFNKNNENTTSSSSNSSSSNELNENVSVSKSKQLHKNINQKIQQLQSQQQQQQSSSPPAQQQQTDYPVFKYLSKNLMNNLFTTKESSSNSENNKQVLNYFDTISKF